MSDRGSELVLNPATIKLAPVLSTEPINPADVVDADVLDLGFPVHHRPAAHQLPGSNMPLLESSEPNNPPEQQIEPNEEMPTSIPEATPINKTINIDVAVVSALGSLEKKVVIRRRDGSEETVTVGARQLLEKQGERFSALARTETEEKWNVDKAMEGAPWYKKWGVKAKVMVERTWRTMATEKLHDIKERVHGMNLVSAAGIEGDFTFEALRAVDAQARLNIAAERDTKWKQIKGGARDVVSEMFGRERDLHRERIKVTVDLKRRFDENPLDKNNPLYDLVMGDREGRESLASRIASAQTETLHAEAGEKRVMGIEVAKDSPVHKFLTEKIFTPAINDSLGRTPPGMSADLRNQLDTELRGYFLTEEFQNWKKTLTC